MEKNREFIVVLRGPSAVIFKPGECLYVNEVPSSLGKVSISYTTRWLEKGEDINFPGHLWIEIRGMASTLEEALVPFGNAGLTIIPIMALSANAAIADPEIEIGFDNTNGITERDYFQNYVPPERYILHYWRFIDANATVKLIEKIGSHPEGERLHRAANQYRLALDSWRLGRETLSLAHLWMALEAITKVKLRAECKARGLDESELAKVLGIDKKELDGTIRKNFIMIGDIECYEKAWEASNGFEHGFLPYAKIRDLSQSVRLRLANYIRNAMLELMEIDHETMTILTTRKFNDPLGFWPIVKYFRSKLIGSGKQLAKEGNAYPVMIWKPDIKSIVVNEEGNLTATVGDSLTAELAEGIHFKELKLEAWKAG